MPYCNPKANNEVQKSKIKTPSKPPPGTIVRDRRIVESPAPMDPEERPSEDPPHDNLAGATQPPCQPPCEGPYCKHCGRELGASPTGVLPNNDNPFSGL